MTDTLGCSWLLIHKHGSLKFRQAYQTGANLAVCAKTCLFEVGHRSFEIWLWLVLIAPQVFHVEFLLAELRGIDPGILLLNLAHSLLSDLLFAHSELKRTQVMTFDLERFG